MTPRIIAIDWSGAKDGAEQKIWLAEVSDHGLVRLECGRGRTAVADHLIAKARRTPELVVGIDFAFSLPSWFLVEQGLTSAPELWDLVERERERWLTECEPPFWGRPGKRCPDLPEHFRRTDRSVPAVGGIRPKSVFQVGGAGAVGTGSLRGMPVLKRLREAGIAVWPFEPPRMPLVVEIYLRALTGVVTKGSPAAREEYLEDLYPALDHGLRQCAAGSEDAFDAAVSALVMAKHREEFTALPAADVHERLEGRIWVPQPRPRSDTTPAPGYGAERLPLQRSDDERSPRRMLCSRTAPGNDTAQWQEIVASILPAPVRIEEPGVLIGGDPGEVIVRIESGRLVVSRYGVCWNGQTPEDAHVQVAAFDMGRARTASVARAITRARADRLRTYGWCALCRRVYLPEWMNDGTICQECAQKHLGVVY